jgi:hypothetical protein
MSIVNDLFEKGVVCSIGKGEYSTTANGTCSMLANTLWWQWALPI